MNNIVIIRIAGKQGLNVKIKDTFKLLRLYKKYSCIIVPNKPTYVGMINKVKDFITWGEVDQPTIQLLLEKRGKMPGKIRLIDSKDINISELAKEIFEGKKTLKSIQGLKPFFNLNPPKGGFEKKGTKKPYSIGGALGYRKEKINELVQKMI